MRLKQLINDYNVNCEQEEKDKAIFLKYMNKFDDVLTRNNDFAHFTSSAFIVNKSRTKVLMIHHNIYNSWTWVGGHADGEEDLLSVAIREVEEETGVKNISLLFDRIACIDTLPVLGHIKHGKYVSAHIHLSVAYIFEGDDREPIKIKEDENSDVSWIDINEIIKLSNEPYMKGIYKKLISIVKGGA